MAEASILLLESIGASQFITLGSQLSANVRSRGPDGLYSSLPIHHLTVEEAPEAARFSCVVCGWIEKYQSSLPWTVEQLKHIAHGVVGGFTTYRQRHVCKVVVDYERTSPDVPAGLTIASSGGSVRLSLLPRHP